MASPSRKANGHEKKNEKRSSHQPVVHRHGIAAGEALKRTVFGVEKWFDWLIGPSGNEPGRRGQGSSPGLRTAEEWSEGRAGFLRRNQEGGAEFFPLPEKMNGKPHRKRIRYGVASQPRPRRSSGEKNRVDEAPGLMRPNHPLSMNPSSDTAGLSCAFPLTGPSAGS